MRTATRRLPSIAGVGGTLLFHLFLALLLLMVRVTVKPMAAPPLEVELMAGDAAPAAETSPPRGPAPTSAGPRELRGEVTPLRYPAPDEPLTPDLPASHTGHSLIPSVSPSHSPSAGPSPGARLAPLPVAARPTAGAGVNVRVEGTLSTRRLIHTVNPVFPPQAPSGGVVKVRLAVPADGTVRSATLVFKAHPLLEEAALDALRQWRFAPAPGASDAEGVVTVEFVVR